MKANIVLDLGEEPTTTTTLLNQHNPRLHSQYFAATPIDMFSAHPPSTKLFCKQRETFAKDYIQPKCRKLWSPVLTNTISVPKLKNQHRKRGKEEFKSQRIRESHMLWDCVSCNVTNSPMLSTLTMPGTRRTTINTQMWTRKFFK